MNTPSSASMKKATKIVDKFWPNPYLLEVKIALALDSARWRRGKPALKYSTIGTSKKAASEK